VDPATGKSLLRNLPTFHTTQDGDPSAPAEQALGSAGRKPNYLKNAFVPLRIARAASDLGDGAVFPNLSAEPPNEEGFYVIYRRFFEVTLHDHLSFSAIPDSRFDPAELIFCLEGLLLCARDAVDQKLFGRVLEVLKDKQEESAHWPPNKPIYATPQGMTMLPVSVEGAVSFLRSISLMEGQSDFWHFSTSAVPMARRFWHWLRARTVRFVAHDPGRSAQKDASSLSGDGQAPLQKGKYKHLTGWHSEHVNDPGLIHLWDTSQVVEFMLAYRELLERSIAGRSLLLSRLNINVPLKGLPADWKNRWAKIIQKFEPSLGCDRSQQLYAQLEKDFIEPWANRKRVNYSMLLYGPPGTGKSSLAKNIANVLGLRMITVTVSDFLGSGGANVEARAKAVFQTLEAQSDSVILFDEIDSFLLDRDSGLYRQQDTLFQFLTPGMLTKINDLGDKRRSMFIIATNYENRIDPAIKRKGRIDKGYLLQLPNKARRIEIIDRLVADRLDDRLGDKLDAKRLAEIKIELKIASSKYRKSIEKHSLFYGFADLKAVVDEASLEVIDEASLETVSAQSIGKLLTQKDRPPSTSLKSYIRRYSEENFPFDELIGLIDLAKEVHEPCDLDLTGDCVEFLNAFGFSEFVVKLKRALADNIHV
jgi:ATPase family associated with various cellular activities (AAA)